MNLSQDNLQLTVSTPLGDDTLQLRSIQGEEQLSGLFHYTLHLVSTQNDLDFASIVGQNLTVTMHLADGRARYIHGLVSRFVQAGHDEQFTTYYAELRPWLWLLTLTSDSRIFQNKTVPDILETVFKSLGCTDYRQSLSATYSAREYCVQYQESSFDFVSRLLEDEGIFYFFEHTADKHTLVLADDADAHPPCPGLSVVPMRQSTMSGSAEDVITACSLEQQVTSDAYALGDFAFETPSTKLFVSVSGASSARQHYEYPGGYSKTTTGEQKANLRLASHELPARLLRGDGHCRAFTAGYRFTLSEHKRTDMNGDYVLQRLVLSATQSQYANSFTAFPASVPFRPPLLTRKPRLHGSQTALVVGKSGEEIWTDQYGRIKVQFHWDREGRSDENSSCWVRVAQAWAGQGWGTLFLPRLGQEVVVSFLNGDPDCPLVTGAVYNAQHSTPYVLPTEQTKSTIKSNSSKGGGGFNELRFDDKKDAEEILLHAQRDLQVTVQHDATTEVLNDATTTIKHARKVTVQEADDTLVVEKGQRTIQVNTGNETHTVKGTRSVTVSGNETHTNKGSFTQDVQGNCTWKIAGNLTLDVQGNVTIQAGGSLTNKASMSLTNEAGMTLTNKASVSLVSSGGGSQSIGADGMVVIGAGMVQIDSSNPT
ncbi:MAG: type VI secretion system Vgr family protein [Candidatus Tectimicrobiota bacterium]